MQDALEWVWPFVRELVDDPDDRAEFDAVLAQVLRTATLVVPAVAGDSARGRSGQHTDALTELLADLQGVARAHPDATW
jgi:ring-1,2-phenylacetyl-CoA epoxidase subunit PaaC